MQVLPAPLVPLVPGLDRDHGGADAAARRARWATRGTASSTRVNIFPKTRAVRHGDARGRAHVDAVGEGHAERGGVQGPQQLHGDRQGRRRTSSASRSTSRRPGSRCCPGVDLLAPVTWSQGISGNAAVAVRRQRGRRQLERRPRRRHLPEVPHRPEVQRLLRQLLDQPDRPTPAAASWACPTARTRRCPTAAGSSLTFKTTF